MGIITALNEEGYKFKKGCKICYESNKCVLVSFIILYTIYIHIWQYGTNKQEMFMILKNIVHSERCVSHVINEN